MDNEVDRIQRDEVAKGFADRIESERLGDVTHDLTQLKSRVEERQGHPLERGDVCGRAGRQAHYLGAAFDS